MQIKGVKIMFPTKETSSTGIKFVTAKEHQEALRYQRQGYEATINLMKWKMEEMLKSFSLDFASKLKTKECMYTKDCFQIYLDTLEEKISSSDADISYMLPAIQDIKHKVFGID